MEAIEEQLKRWDKLRRSALCTLFCLHFVGCLALPDPVEMYDSTTMPTDAAVSALDGASLTDGPELDSIIVSEVGAGPTDLNFTDMDESGNVVVDAAVIMIDASAPCGNGVIDVGEECDDGGPTPRCSVDCTEIVCGNSRIDAGEVCDDGNQDDTDGCIDNCSAMFPDTWSVLVESNDLSLPGSVPLYCDQTPPENVSIHPRREVVHGRESLRLWTYDSEVWIPFGAALTRPTRLSLSAFVPDGFKRKFRFVLASNDPECGAELLGPFIRHKDRKDRDDEPLVEVSVGIRPQEFSYFAPDSGLPDQWVELSMVILPETGHVRFWYAGRYITQIRLSGGFSVGHLRLLAKYEEDAGIGDSISVSNFRVEEAQP